MNRTTFVRLGFADAEDIARKALIVMHMARGLRAVRVTLADPGTLLRLPRSDLAMILAGKFQHLRLDQLSQRRARVLRLRGRDTRWSDSSHGLPSPGKPSPRRRVGEHQLSQEQGGHAPCHGWDPR